MLKDNTPLPPALEALRTKIADRSVVVGIFGLGYVGLPLALRFAKSASAYSASTLTIPKYKKLNNGGSYIERITPELINTARDQGFSATTDFSRVTEVDALIICVPTPLNRQREPDLSFIVNTMESALPHMREGQLVSLESTTWPGTTEEILAPRLESRTLIPGQNCALVFSPEREDPGNPTTAPKTSPRSSAVSRPCASHSANPYIRTGHPNHGPRQQHQSR